jgi:hypothetical protein
MNEEAAMPTEVELRQGAVKAIKRRREFWYHVLSYCIVNAFLIVIWYMTGRGYFWPGWILAAWGIGLVFNAWKVFGPPAGGISEEQIQKEIDRQRTG